MKLTIEQIKVRRGVRLLALDADPDAEKGVDFKVTHETDPSSIEIWNEVKLGPEPTHAQIIARSDQQSVVQKKNLLRRYSLFRIFDDIADVASLTVDNTRMVQLLDIQQNGTPTQAEQNQLDDLRDQAVEVRKRVRARLNVMPTITAEDTPQQIYDRYEAELELV
jgi:hypothetical protein